MVKLKKDWYENLKEGDAVYLIKDDYNLEPGLYLIIKHILHEPDKLYTSGDIPFFQLTYLDGEATNRGVPVNYLIPVTNTKVAKILYGR